jgi:hypothetical protein
MTEEEATEEDRQDRQDQESVWEKLPECISTHVFEFLDIDDTGTCRLISTKWSILASEENFKKYCETVYFSQSLKSIMNVAKYGSYERMLINRPRLRTNGHYILRTSYFRPPNNDAFWEERRSEMIEQKLYRKFRFFRGSNRVLYNHNQRDAHELERDSNWVQGRCVEKSIFEGVFSVQKSEVTVEIITHYCVLHFILLIRDGNGGLSYTDKHGAGHSSKFGALVLQRHWSTDLMGRNETSYPVPQYEKPFRFWRTSWV